MLKFLHNDSRFQRNDKLPARLSCISYYRANVRYFIYDNSSAKHIQKANKEKKEKPKKERQPYREKDKMEVVYRKYGTWDI
jgi:hypothetical protein